MVTDTSASLEGDETPSDPTLSVDPLLYINRELSWLEFNQRVLEEACNERHPLLERVKFLAIFGSNLDEFFMIRVSGLQEQRTAGVADVARDGLSPTQALAKIAVRVDALLAEAHACWGRLHDLLRHQHILVRRYTDLSREEKESLANYFHHEIFPILTPLAIDPGRPFPHISNLALNLAVIVRDPQAGDRFARIKIPGTLPRLVPVSAPSPEANGKDTPATFVWLEELVAAHIGTLFPGLEVAEVYPFRVTRNADIDIQEDEADDLLRTVQAGLQQRHFGFVTRLEIPPGLPERIRTALVKELKTDPHNVVTVHGEMGHSSLMELMKLDRPGLKDPPLVPLIPPLLATGEDLFSVLSQEDVLLHHPYDSFAPVIGLVETAASDDDVLAIKQTLYRVGSSSPIVEALAEARDADTQVAVLVELKARFDEESNIGWTRRLEQAGVHVAYGLIGLKTHCKVLLVVRREPGGVRRYLHLGTGNYNATTARIYTDFSFMTADPALGEDASELFNLLTGYSRQSEFRKMLVAPINLRSRMAGMIRREAEHARAGKPGRILMKMNQLVDPEMIDLLYEASQAGVKVDLIVRGICCLRPGVSGVSENVRVISLVGRFLEHSRAFYFENAGEPELYLGSADLMERNLDRRVEVLFPVENPALRNGVVRDVLEVQLQDTANSRQLHADGTYHKVSPEEGKKTLDSQAVFLARRTGPTRPHLLSSQPDSLMRRRNKGANRPRKNRKSSD